MGIVVIIDGREAIPVRAIPFVAGWMISPDVVAKSFAKTDHWITRLDGVAAYYLAAEGTYSPMLAKEWDVIEADLEILSDKLKATEEVEQENYSDWRPQSILRLPASCFVWRDEFEEAFRRSYSPKRLILLNERPGDRELNFSPRIPEELTLAVMQGFSVIQPNNNSSSSVEKPLYPKEGEAHLKLDVGMNVNTPVLFDAMKNLTADELSITFVGDKTEAGIGANNMLEISARGKTRRVALAALDLVDRRNGSLNSQGMILLGMAQKKKLPYTAPNAAKMMRLREVFRKHLGINDDPFGRYRKGVGWEPHFKVFDNRGAADERAKREAERRTDSYEQLNESGEKGGDAADEWLKNNDSNATA